MGEAVSITVTRYMYVHVMCVLQIKKKVCLKRKHSVSLEVLSLLMSHTLKN